MPRFKNIVGSAFPQFVKDQINYRKTTVNKQTRTSNDLQWMTNRTGWFRMSSAAKINNSIDLAKNNILQGGTVTLKDENSSTINQKQGFSETYSKGATDSLGLQPMPGIVGLSVGTGGRWQTLLQADVDFICYNLDQLETISKLYMSLGVHVFIEWGHTPYIKGVDANGNSQLEYNNLPLPFFSKEYTGENGRRLLLRKISEKIKNTNGNYGALLGRVYNFDYTANPNGTYSCKAKVMGPGAMAESLRINKSSQIDFDKSLTSESAKYASDLENALYAIRNFLRRAEISKLETVRYGDYTSSSARPTTTKANLGVVSNTNFFDTFKFLSDKYSKADVLTRANAWLGQAIGNSFYSDYYANTSYGSLLNTIYDISTYRGPKFLPSGIGGTVDYRGNKFLSLGNAHQIISNLKDNDSDDELSPVPMSMFYGYSSSFPVKNGEEGEEVLESTYITLGHLMCLIQHIGVCVEGEGDNAEPSLYIDYHPDNTIALTAPLEASVDPSKCLVPFKMNTTSNEGPQRAFAKFFKPLNTCKETPYEWEVEKPKNQSNLKRNLTVVTEENAINKTFNTLGVKYEGKIFNILINLDFAINTLRGISNAKEDKEVNLLEYINKILDGVNLSLGKVNNLRAFFDDSCHAIRIVDENVVEPIEEYLEIPTFGLQSVAYDYSYSSKISPNLASQIVIASQAQDTGKLKDFPEDVLTYNHLNGGVVDRLSPTISPGTSKSVEQQAGSDDIRLKSLQKLYDHIYYVYSLKEGIDISTMSNLTTTFADLQNMQRKYYKNKAATIVIPLEFSITLDGISGILPYNAFLIPDNRLPARYRGRVAFCVFSINHEFNSNQWNTTIKGQTISRQFPFIEDDRKLYPEEENPQKPLTPTTVVDNPIVSTNYGGNVPVEFQTTQNQPSPIAQPTPEDLQEETTIVPPFTEPNTTPQTPPPTQTPPPPTPISIPPNDIIGVTSIIKSEEPRVPNVPELEAYGDIDYTKDPSGNTVTYRIGWGSDTITRSDGSVVTVKKGDRITEADANRDLNRRLTTQYKPQVIKRCADRGLDYNSISDFRVQAVFLDCAYNYGTLWYSIIDSYINGGVPGLIQELKNRIARGEGQVPHRRQAEIDYLGG